MKRIALTKRNIDRIPFTEYGQVTYWDTDLPGFGLLVGKRSKTFLVQVDVKDNSKPKGYRTVKKTLGRYGDLTAEQARKLVNGHHNDEGGFVPGKRLELKSGGPLTDNGRSITIQQMLAFYFQEKKRQDGKPFKPATVTGYTRIIEQHFKSWLSLTLPDVAKLTPERVIERHKQIEVDENHGPYAARNAFVMLTAIINYALIRHPGAITVNPLNVLRLGRHMKKIEARTDKLDINDFRTFHAAIQKFNGITRDAYLVCLYQGLRSTEAAALRWEHVNMEKEELFIPDTKNRRPLHVPLCRQSLAILKLRQEQNPEGTPFVFPSLPRPQCLNKTGHVRLMAAQLKAKTGLDLTVHGLRRSFTTIGKKLKLHEETDRLTNHIDSSVTGRHYDGRDVDDMRQPLQSIANEIERLMKEGTGAKVIHLPMA